MPERVKTVLIYAGKCMTATLVVFLLSAALDYKDMAWCLISVILVLSPDGKEAFPLAFTRIKANLVGASVGVLCLLIAAPNMWILAFALAVTLSLCYLFRFDAAARSALAATIIVMLHDTGKHLWDTALERVIAVVAGCTLGLIITVAFHFKEKTFDKKTDNHAEA